MDTYKLKLKDGSTATLMCTSLGDMDDELVAQLAEEEGIINDAEDVVEVTNV